MLTQGHGAWRRGYGTGREYGTEAQGTGARVAEKDCMPIDQWGAWDLGSARKRGYSFRRGLQCGNRYTGAACHRGQARMLRVLGKAGERGARLWAGWVQ